MTRNTIPSFADKLPARAAKLDDLSLPFYCINCQRKAETTYLTSDFGPFCDDCLEEIKPLLKPGALDRRTVKIIVNDPAMLCCPQCYEDGAEVRLLKGINSDKYCPNHGVVIEGKR